MPSRPDAERIGAYLTEAERESVAEWCRESRVPLESWPEHADCRSWLDLAIRRAMAWLRQNKRARSDTAALRFVCGSFGLSADAVDRRWRRRTRARMRTTCPPFAGKAG